MLLKITILSMILCITMCLCVKTIAGLHYLVAGSIMFTDSAQTTQKEEITNTKPKKRELENLTTYCKTNKL